MLRVDVPALGVQGAVVSVLGGADQIYGFTVFPDIDGFDAFIAAMDVHDPGSDLDFGTSVLALELEPLESLPDAARQEIAQHGWPAVEARYPWITLRERDGSLLPVDRAKYEIVTAIASTLGTFCMRNAEVLAHEATGADVEPVSATIDSTKLPDVRYTFPCDAFGLFTDKYEDEPDARSMPVRAARVPGRNEPCHCGSGRKYKHCHLDEDDRAAAAAVPAARAVLGAEMVEVICGYADARWRAAWRRHHRDFRDADAAAQLAREWSVFHFEVEGTTAAAAFLAEHGAKLTPAERRWVADQIKATLSVWEVLSVDRGTSFVARDVLLGTERTVHDRKASGSLVPRDSILARIVEENGRFIIQGVHPRPLSPFAAQHVVEAARKRLRLRHDERADFDAIRPVRFGRFLITQWEDAVEQMDAERHHPPRMTTMDGDDVVLCQVDYGFDRSRRADLVTAIDSLVGVSRSKVDRDDDGGVVVYSFMAPNSSTRDAPAAGGRSIEGQLWVERDRARLVTNSRTRLARLTAALRSVTGDLLREQERTETDAREQYLEWLQNEESGGRGAGTAARLETVPPPELASKLREVKYEEYHRWMDAPIPALDGKTPRQAARLVRGRQTLDLLLRDMENREARLPEWERFDFSLIRAVLRLPG